MSVRVDAPVVSGAASVTRDVFEEGRSVMLFCILHLFPIVLNEVKRKVARSKRGEVH